MADAAAMNHKKSSGSAGVTAAKYEWDLQNFS